MHDVGREALVFGVDALLVQRVPVRVEPFAERGDEADAGDPDFLVAADLGSVMRHRLHGKADRGGHRVHVHAHRGIGEGGKTEGQLGAALQLALPTRPLACVTA